MKVTQISIVQKTVILFKEIMKKNQRCAKFKLETLERKLSKAFVELWVESSVTSWTDSYGRVYRNNIEKSELCKIFNYEEKSRAKKSTARNGEQSQ